MAEQKIELYDVGRVLIKPFEAGYKFIAEQGESYISDGEALARIKAFHKDRTLKLAQSDFDLLDRAWLTAINGSKLIVDPAQLVYDDVRPTFELAKKERRNIFLHTSGSRDLIKAMLGGIYNSVDEIITGSDGDKNNPETFYKIGKQYPDIALFCDDKPSVLEAAKDGFHVAGTHPSLYLVDRTASVHQDRINHLKNNLLIHYATSIEEARSDYTFDYASLG